MKKQLIKKIVSTMMVGALVVGLSACGGGSGNQGSTKTDDAAANGKDGIVTMTNVSYDPTRELYEQYNEAFKAHYKEENGTDVEVVQSHGGSGGQARSVVEGAAADVVTLALAHDITLIEQSGLIEPGWLDEFDKESSPYTSTIVFLVRKGNDKNLKDWDDLIKDGVEIINPDPKSSGGACWNFLAAWQFAKDKFDGDEEKMKEFMTALYNNVTVMDSGARGATTTFVENGQGDVLIAWENEALATVKEYPDEYEIISPSISILAQPSVAILDENAKKDNVTDVAKAYLEYLYSDEAQQIIGENGYRPSNEEILNTFSDKFDLDMNLCTIDDFGGWDEAYDTFFNDGAIFDEIYNQ